MNKEIIETLKKMVEDGNLSQEIAEKYCPELAESEDEKIRKSLIYHYQGDGCLCTDKYRIDYKEIRAWLEKQGKEEYALKSFKDEDVRKFMQCIEKQAKAYEFNLPNRGYDIYAFAKDLLVWLEKQGEQHPKFRIGDTIKKKSTGDIVTISEIDLKNREYRLSNTGFIPFKYEHLWELVEQKPMNEKSLYKAGYFDGFEDGVRDAVIKEDESADKVEQKSAAWNEEDEKIVNLILCICNDFKKVYSQSKTALKDADKIESFLKSLKERVLPQPEQEWSEEDEEILASIEQLMSDTESENGWNCVYLSDNDKEVHYSTIRNWLKSLRPQNMWKPDLIELEELRRAAYLSADFDANTLKNLYQQLKALTE